MNTLFNWAKRYRAYGWNVLPLMSHEKGKIPTLETDKQIGWLQWKDKKPTDEEFERLFSYPSITGIALITGKTSNVTVVDYDSYIKGAVKLDVDAALISKTASGGHHYFYKFEEELTENRLISSGLELKNATIIVLPPSEVINKQGVLADYEWEKVSKNPILTPIPTNIKALFQKENRIKLKIADLIKPASGQRHNNLLSIANIMYLRSPQNEWDIIDDYLYSQAANCDPPYQTSTEMKDFARILNDAKNFVRNNKKEDVEKAIAELPTPRSVLETALERIEEKKLERVAPSTGYPDLDQLVSGFVPKRVYAVTGLENIGKTSLACNFADRLRRQGRRCLYLALEPENNVVDYLASVRLDKPFNELTDEDIKYDDGNIHILGKKEIDTLDKLVRYLKGSERYDLVIVDHIGYFMHDRVNWVQEQSNTVKEIVKIAQEKMCAIMLIAHLRKRDKSSKKVYTPTSDDISGSGAFKQDCTDVFIVTKEVKDNATSIYDYSNRGKLHVTKTKSGGYGEVQLIFGDKKANIFSLGEMEVGNFTEEQRIDAMI